MKDIVNDEILLKIKFDDLDCINTGLGIALATIKSNPQYFGRDLKNNISKVFNELSDIQIELLESSNE